jgi:hypothetical protein
MIQPQRRSRSIKSQTTQRRWSRRFSTPFDRGRVCRVVTNRFPAAGRERLHRLRGRRRAQTPARILTLLVMLVAEEGLPERELLIDRVRDAPRGPAFIEFWT